MPPIGNFNTRGAICQDPKAVAEIQGSGGLKWLTRTKPPQGNRFGPCHVKMPKLVKPFGNGIVAILGA